MHARKIASRLLFSIGAAVATSATAQPPSGPPGPPMDVERLAVLLDLDAYQKQEVGRILDEQRQARVAQREAFDASGERPSFEEMEARREQMQQQLLSELQTVLTEQQIEKFKVLMERPQGRQRRAVND